MVLWQIDILVQFCTFVFISSQIWKGHKWVRRSKSSQGSIQIWSNGIQCENRKIFYWRVTGALLCIKNIKVPFGIGHPPPTHSNLVYMCAGRSHKSSNRIELSQSVQELLLFFWFQFPWLWGVGQVAGGWSGMFRGKEPSNKIKLSRLVQDLLNFGVLGSLQLWGWGVGGWGWGVVGGCPHTYAHTHACTHMHMW